MPDDERPLGADGGKARLRAAEGPRRLSGAAAKVIAAVGLLASAQAGAQDSAGWAIVLRNQAAAAVQQARSAAAAAISAAAAAQAKAESASQAAISAATTAQVAQAAIPPVCAAKPAIDTANGTVGTAATCVRRADAAPQATVMPAQATTAADGSFSGFWPGTFPAVPTTAIASVKSASAPYTCQVATFTTTTFNGKCWQVTPMTLPGAVTSLPGLMLTPYAPPPVGSTVMVVGRL